MKMIWMVMALMGASVATGCRPTSQENYEVQKEVMIGSPAAYRYHVEHCVTSLRTAPFRSKRLIDLAQTPMDRGVVPVCERIMRAVRDGKLSYEAYLSLFREQETAEVVRVLREP